jgi:hypothetical protein
MRNTVIVFAAALLFTCGNASSHKADRTVSFTEADGAGKLVRVLVVALTDEKGTACIGGNWKRARIVSDPDKYTDDPVYKVEAGKLEVLLINHFCDAYDSYVGEISNGTFSGDHVQYGWSSRTVGKVTGTLSAE